MNVINSLLTILYPPFCAGCRKLGNFLCSSCANNIHWLPPIPVPVLNSTPGLEQAFAASAYSTTTIQLLHWWKYSSVRPIGQLLAKLMYYHFPIPKSDIITAVPLHHNKQTERGFNQAADLALTLAQLLGRRYLPLLDRKRSNRAQASLNTTLERKVNSSDIFSLSTTSLTNQKWLKGQSILIIDDVITTGATVTAAATELKKLHPKKVCSLCFAHKQ